MRLLSSEQLDKLSSNMGLFTPSELNDTSRIDLTDGLPFVAIDTRRPDMIDDAIRVKVTRDGGFLVQAAIADGAQLSAAPKYIREAMMIGESVYRGNICLKSMLPGYVTNRLELATRRSPQRALVVERRYDVDARPLTPPDVYPATVNIKNYRYAEFTAHVLPAQGGVNAPIVRFSEAFRDTRSDLEYELPMALGGNKSNASYGGQVTQDHMVLANHGITQAAIERGIPLLHRRYPSIESTWGSGQHRRSRDIHLLGSEMPDNEVPYARATSPLHEGISLANHLLFGLHMAGGTTETIEVMALEMQEVLNT